MFIRNLFLSNIVTLNFFLLILRCNLLSEMLREVAEK